MHVKEKDTAEIKWTHTPGPWRSDETLHRNLPQGNGTRRTFEIFTNADIPAHRHIATVEERGVLKPSEGEANARLIAAAPDLLALLVELKASSYGAAVREEYEDRVEAAIARAEGR